MSSDVETVQRVIAAPAQKIFALVADPGRHQEFDGSGTVREATQQPEHLALGATFGMHMRAGLAYTMRSTVVEWEDGRRIAWQSRPTRALFGQLVGGRIWRYVLEPVEGGTLVSESWDISQERHPSLIRPLRSLTRTNMTRTLERIERIVTA